MKAPLSPHPRRGRGFPRAATLVAALATTLVLLFALLLPALAAAGDLDTSFSDDGKVTTDFAGGWDQAYGVAIQGDGKIVVVGYSGDAFAVARYNSDGTLDASFDGDGKVTTSFAGNRTARAVAIQSSDQKIVVVGGDNDFALARYNTDGSLDTSFDGDGKVTTNFSNVDEAYGVAIQSDGKLVVAGRVNGTDDFGVARYNTNGSLDTDFDGDGKVITSGFGQPRGIAIQSNGKLVVAGHSGGNFALARYHGLSDTGTPGSLDTSFDGDGKLTTDFGGADEARGVAIQSSDQKIVVAGISGSDFGLARYNTNGALDTTFDTDGTVTTDFASGNDRAYGVAIQGDGKIVVAGVANYSISGFPPTYTGDFGVARYNSDGSLDASFGASGKVGTSFTTGWDEARGVAIQGDGKLVVAGFANQVDFAVARYVSATTQALTSALGEAATLAEALQKAVGKGVSEGAALGEGIARAVGLSRSEGAALGEGVQQGVGKGAAEGASLSSTLGLGLSPSASASLAETLTQALGLSRSDAAALAEALQKAVGRGVSEGAALGEGIARAVGLSRSEGAALAEALQKAVGKGATDGASLSSTLGLGLSPTSSATLTEALAKALGLSRSDAAALAEALQKAVGRGVSEGAALGEAVTKGIVSGPLAGATLQDYILLRVVVPPVRRNQPYGEGAVLGEGVQKGLGKGVSERAALGEAVTKAIATGLRVGAAVQESISWHVVRAPAPPTPTPTPMPIATPTATPLPAPTATPIPTPTPMLTPVTPVVIGEARGIVLPDAPYVIVAPDQRGRLVVPAGAPPASVQTQRVEIEFKNLKEDTVPALPSGEVVVASYEVNTLVDGVRTPLTYDRPVEFSFLVSREDLQAAGGDPARLRLLRFLPEEGRWSEVAARYETEPPPAGRLVAELNHFSLFAIGLLPVAPPPTAMPTPTAAPTPTVVPPIPAGKGFPVVYVILGVAALVVLVVLLVWRHRGRRRTG